MDSVAAVILAAGASRRFGSPKQMARLGDGKTFLERQLELVESVDIVDPYVIVGAYSEKILPLLSIRPSVVIESEHWQQGMSASIRSAVNALESKYSAILFLAVDQILIEPEHLLSLLRLASHSGESIIATRYNGKAFGIPAFFPKKYYSDLKTLKHDVGAKKVVSKYIENVVFYQCSAAEVDIDTPSQLKKLKRKSKSGEREQ